MYEAQEASWKHLTYQSRGLHLNEQSMEANTSSEELSQAHIQTRLLLPRSSTS